MKELVLKICGNTWEMASRDKRELSVYKELGSDVLVMAKGESEDKGREEIIDGFRVLRYSTRPLGERVPNAINRLVSLLMWASYARRIKPDIISGHDLMPGLTIAWLSTLFQFPKPKLIYDAHEFELGRNTYGKRKRVVKWFLALEEKYLMNRCELSIVVNDSIADEVTSIHKLKQRPLVIRNIPTIWSVNEDECLKVREEFKNYFIKNAKQERALQDEQFFMVIYHGVIGPDRGIDTLIRLASINPNVRIVILGDGEKVFVSSLLKLVCDLNVESKVLFHKAVPQTELWKYIGAVDLSVMMIGSAAQSYYYALPNKLFESIQSLTPIVASSFPEMKKVIDQYEIGLTCDPNDLNAVNECVERIRTDHALYEKMKKNIYKAKTELCWENEKKALVNAYKNLQKR